MRRGRYLALFAGLLIAEILIALFVRDRFVRPYVGDALVTVLICALCRVISPQRPRLLALYVFLFAAAVEIGQYFDYAALLGLAESRFFSALLGRTFSFTDLICYAAGCVAFAAAELLARRKGGTP